MSKGLIKYRDYLWRNLFRYNDESVCKYLRRYNQYGFNKYLEDINNMVIVKHSDKKYVQRPKYNYEKGVN